MPTDRAMELETQRCPTCGSWVPKMSETAPSPAVAEVEIGPDTTLTVTHQRETYRGPGRCDRHKDEPGPSLYFDCCEVERLRELIKVREPSVAEAVEALEECADKLEAQAQRPIATGPLTRASLLDAVTRARAALANLKP